jgi:K+-transporting ATPase ATPase A chain
MKDRSNVAAASASCRHIGAPIRPGRFLPCLGQRRALPAPAWLHWFEERLNTGNQSWKQYAVALLLFNTVMFVFGFAVLALQPYLPLNPDGKKMLAPTTIFNAVTSFLTNTNLQHYSGEQHFSYFSQIVFVLWNMFVSASVGYCALAAIIRGLRGDAHMGNFYLDLWRAVVYIFLPASLIMGVLLLADGVPMTFQGAAEVATLEPGAMGTTPEGQPQLQQTIARGPVAAVIPIKHLGTNGGGFFGANSAHSFENPSAWSNFLTCINILVFPLSLVIMFGKMLSNMRHALVIYGTMMAMFAAMIVWAISWDTLHPNPGLTAQTGQVYPLDLPQADGTTRHVWMVADAGAPGGVVPRDPARQGEDRPQPSLLAGLPIDQELGNLEGKELRFGTSAGATFSAVTTAIACGSVNCMHDSLNPLASLTPFAGMWLNCIFGGKGVGLINLLLYLIVGVFLAGLMVGRTPEYLGKKVEAREMKLAMLALLVHPILVLGSTGLFAALDWGRKATNNPGPHGFSEVLYEFSSSSANNGSGFEGLNDTWGFNDNTDPAP